MNSGALVKVETRDSWMERALGARGARLLLAAGGTIAVVLTVPTALLEDIATASGLSELTKYFAPPIGLGSRLLLGGGLALVPAGVVWALWGSPAAPAEPQPRYEAELFEIEDEDEMMHARKQASPSSSPWGAIIRLVRGGFHDNADTQDDLLSRRRRDSHPDAPPRPPLSASRDLPPHDSLSMVETDVAPPAPFVADFDPTVTPGIAPAFVSSFADAVAKVAPVPAPMPDILMPRAPAALTEEEIAQAVANIPPRTPPVTAAPTPTTPLVRRPATFAKETSADLLGELDLPLIADANLADLAARLERGIAKREAVAHAQEAQQSISSSIAFAQPDPSVRTALRAQRSVEVVAPPVATQASDDDVTETSLLRVDEDVEHALNSALTTLRKLTEQGRR